MRLINDLRGTIRAGMRSPGQALSIENYSGDDCHLVAQNVINNSQSRNPIIRVACRLVDAMAGAEA